MVSKKTSKKTYHHGDLRTALLAAAEEELAVAYADDFGGQLIKTGDVTPAMSTLSSPCAAAAS